MLESGHQSPIEAPGGQVRAPGRQGGGTERKLGYRWAILVLVGSLILSAVLSGAWRPLIDAFFDRDDNDRFMVATYTINARTESLSFRPVPSLSHGWALPPGVVTVARRDGNRPCLKADSEKSADRDMDDDCQMATDGNALLKVSGNAVVRLDATPTSVLISIQPDGDGTMLAEIQDRHDPGKDFVARSGNMLSFETTAGGDDMAMRLPIIAADVTLGSALYESASVPAGVADRIQPMLLQGEYEVLVGIGRRQGRDPYAILDGSVGPGDVVELGRSCSSGAKSGADGGDGTIRGIASVPRPDASAWPVINVSMNACVPVGFKSDRLRQIKVKRFGSTANTELIMPSIWVALSAWPQWNSFWLTTVAVMFILSFVPQIAGSRHFRQPGPASAGAPPGPAAADRAMVAKPAVAAPKAPDEDRSHPLDHAPTGTRAESRSCEE